jgi:hypothetical protein
MTLLLEDLETLFGRPREPKGPIQLEELIAVELRREIVSHGSRSR